MKATLVAVVAALVAAVPAAALSGAGGTDWGRFGYDTARHDAAPAGTLTAANVVAGSTGGRFGSTAPSTRRRSTCTA